MRQRGEELRCTSSYLAKVNNLFQGIDVMDLVILST